LWADTTSSELRVIAENMEFDCLGPLSFLGTLQVVGTIMGKTIMGKTKFAAAKQPKKLRLSTPAINVMYFGYKLSGHIHLPRSYGSNA
jgi:hypothetical protein